MQSYIVMIVNKLLRLALGSILVAGCAKGDVEVEISREDYRAKFVEVLTAEDIPFEVDDSGRITVIGFTAAELQRRMQDYDDYVSADLGKMNKEHNSPVQ